MHTFSINWLNDYKENVNHIKSYLPSNPRYLEIGVFEGRSFCHALETLEPSLAIGVDPYIDIYYTFNQEVSYQKALKNIELSCKNTVWKINRMNSDTFFSSDIEEYKDSYFDLVYIDGSHEYIDAKKDILNVITLLKPRVIIIDDYHWEDVKRAIFDISDITDKNYALEIANHQYVLVRRDCYSKACSS